MLGGGVVNDQVQGLSLRRGGVEGEVEGSEGGFGVGEDIEHRQRPRCSRSSVKLLRDALARMLAA